MQPQPYKVAQRRKFAATQTKSQMRTHTRPQKKDKGDGFRAVFPSKYVGHVEAYWMAQDEQRDAADIQHLENFEAAHRGNNNNNNNSNDNNNNNNNNNDGDNDNDNDNNNDSDDKPVEGDERWNWLVGNDTVDIVVSRSEDDNTISIHINDELQDWLHRDQEGEQGGLWVLSLAEYLAWYKTKKPRPSDRQDPDSTVGRPCNPTVDLHPSHPLAKSHKQQLQSVEQTLRFVGGAFPRNNHPQDFGRERYARWVLTFFKPWRRPAELRTQDETWQQALAAWRPNMPAWVVERLYNLQLFHDGLDAATRARNNQTDYFQYVAPMSKTLRNAFEKMDDAERELLNPADLDKINALCASSMKESAAIRAAARCGRFDVELDPIAVEAFLPKRQWTVVRGKPKRKTNAAQANKTDTNNRNDDDDDGDSGDKNNGEEEANQPLADTIIQDRYYGKSRRQPLGDMLQEPVDAVAFLLHSLTCMRSANASKTVSAPPTRPHPLQT